MNSPLDHLTLRNVGSSQLLVDFRGGVAAWRVWETADGILDQAPITQTKKNI